MYSYLVFLGYVADNFSVYTDTLLVVKMFCTIFLETGLQVMTVLLYAFIVYAVCQVETSIYITFIRKVNQMGYLSHSMTSLAAQLNKPLRKISYLQRRFDFLFSILPVGWLLNLLLIMSGNLLVFSIKPIRTNKILFVSEMLSLLVNITTTLGAVFLASHFIEQTDREKSKLIDTLLTNLEPSLMKMELIKLLERHQFKLTGWSLFRINKSLLVSYVGAIGTFSILFANLSGARI